MSDEVRDMVVDAKADIKNLSHDLSIALKDIEKMKKDVDEAHKKIRHHEDRMLKKANHWLWKAVKYLSTLLAGTILGKEIIR